MVAPGLTGSLTSTDSTISVDVMSGEGGLAAVIGGLADVQTSYPNLNFILHGDQSKIERLLERRPKLRDVSKVQHTDTVIAMDEKPALAARRGKGSSMWNAVQSVKSGEADVTVSCGNTGALMAISLLVLRRVEGVHRPAIAIYWPSKNPSGYNIMLDVGADIRAESPDLINYAVMGAAYASDGLGLKRPRVGLLNVGTEDHKGRDALQIAASFLDASEDDAFDYIGFVEGGDIPSDRVDVIVTDGFTGNVALKTAEGTANVISELLKDALLGSYLARAGAFLAQGSLRKLKRRIDPRGANGGVFLGLNGTVVKSHGAADSKGVAAATELAVRLAQNKFQERLAGRVASVAHASEHGTKT